MKKKDRAACAFMSCGGRISYTIKEKQNIQVTDFKYKQELEKKELKCLPIGDSLN